MATFVTKKDGTRVPFDQEKLRASILSAALDAEMEHDEAEQLSTDVATLVAGTFSDREEAPTFEISEKVLAELDASWPAVAEAWRKYEETKHE